MSGDDRTTYLNAVCPGEEYMWHDEGSRVPAWNIIVDIKTGVAFTVANVWAHEDPRIPRIMVADLLDQGFKP